MAEKVTIEIRGIDRASGALRSVGSALGRVSQIALGLIAYRVFERLAGGLFNLAKQAAEAYQWFDQIRFALGELSRADVLDRFAETELTAEGMAKVLQFASDEAEGLLDWIIRLGLESPFTAKDVNQMFRLMRAYGFTTERAQALTGTILDFSAATGFGSQVLERMGLALGQVQQRGRLAGEEIRQLINVGIPVRDIVAKAMEVTTGELEKMIRKGLVPASEALPAIVEWMERFDGASERAVTTWWGLVNNMKDVKELGMIKVFDGIAKAAQPALASLFDFLSSERTFTMFEKIGEKLGDWLVPILEGIPDAITLLSSLETVLTGVKSGAIEPEKAVAWILSMLGVIESEDVQNVSDTIGGIADSFDWFADSITKITDVWTGAIKDELPDWLASLGDISIGGFDSFVPMWERFTDTFERMSEVAVPQIMTDLTEGLDGLTTWWTDKGAGPAAEIVDFILTLGGGGVIGAIASAAATFGMLGDIAAGRDPMPRLEALGRLFETLAAETAGTQIFQDFATSLSQLVAIPSLTEENLLGAAASGQAVADGVMGGITGGVQAAESQVATDVMNSLSASITDPAAFWASLTGEQQARIVGGRVAESLGDGFLNEMASQKAEVRKMLDEIVAMINEAYGIKSPSKVFTNIGGQMAVGLVQGLVERAQEGMKEIQLMGSKLQNLVEYSLFPSTLSPATVGAAVPSIAANPPGAPPTVNVVVESGEGGDEGKKVVFENVNIQEKLTATAFGLAFEEYTGVR
jgi:tape measure domain-containing protein